MWWWRRCRQHLFKNVLKSTARKEHITKKRQMPKVFFYSYDFSHILHTSFGSAEQSKYAGISLCVCLLASEYGHCYAFATGRVNERTTALNCSLSVAFFGNSIITQLSITILKDIGKNANDYDKNCSRIIKMFDQFCRQSFHERTKT